MKRYDILIPIRLDSKRLPNKALLEIDGLAIIEILVHRMRQCKKIRNVIICTTNKRSDLRLVKYCNQNRIKIVRGNNDDILARYLEAVKLFDTEFIISVDGDDIYQDPKLIDQIIEQYEKTNADFIELYGVPTGFISSGFTRKALEKVCKNIHGDTNFIKPFRNPNLFKIKYLNQELKFPKNLRLSLDYHEDYHLAQNIFHRLKNDFTIKDVLELVLDSPTLSLLARVNDNKWEEHWIKTK